MLYNGELLVKDYYNTTTEVNPHTGVPYGFFHQTLPGKCRTSNRFLSTRGGGYKLLT